jgi:hypothetical protein
MDEVRVYNRPLSAAEVAALAIPPKSAVMPSFSLQSETAASIAARGEGGARAGALTAEEAPGSGNPPSLAIVKVTAEAVVVALRADGSRSYIVEASDDLVRWVQLTNVTAAGTNLFTDRSRSAGRFYRLVPSSITK